jgi:hypothetical protein
VELGFGCKPLVLRRIGKFLGLVIVGAEIEAVSARG